jgi:hypothetical protein
MKVWSGYGSEHSYNLVLIGHFADATTAKVTKEKFERLVSLATDKLPERDWDDQNPRFDREVREALHEMSLWDFSRGDLEQFTYDVSMSQTGDRVELTTDEGEVQGYIKLLIDAGARVEVYSAHHWDEAGQPRGGAAPTEESDVAAEALETDDRAATTEAAAGDERAGDGGDQAGDGQ